MADQSVDASRGNIAPSAPPTVSQPSDYIPAVGDVVEFEYKRRNLKGLVGYCRDGGLVVWARHDPKWSSPTHNSLREYPIKKMLYSVGGSLDYESSKEKAMELFFSAPTFTGSYAERQKQWIEHHGLKVGDKVRVVRKFKYCEDGFDGTKWDLPDSKAVMQGRAYLIERVSSGHIILNGNYFPYFALEPVK
jgi:hypothetical protein